MIYTLSTKLIEGLYENRKISSEDLDIIIYGTFSLISKTIYFIISVITGFVFKIALESVIFYFSFLFIKKYTGGYHAKTERKCFILSTVSIFLSIATIYCATRNHVFTEIVYCSSILLGFIIVLFAPVPSKERPLNDNEVRKFKVIARIRLAVLFVLIISTALLGFKYVSTSICASVILNGLILLKGKAYSKYET